MVLVLEEEEKPISGEDMTVSTVVIMPEEEPTPANGAMISDKTTMTLQATNGSDQMSNKS